MIGVFAITRGGARLGRRVVKALSHSRPLNAPDSMRGMRGRLHVLARFKVGGFKDLRQEVGRVFKRYDGLIFIMATGIVVRTIAPFLKDKTKDPAIVVVDERGEYAISLLSGHLGGANHLARIVARAIGARPVITTATDALGLPCIEDIARRFNCVIEDVKGIKLVNSVIVDGGKVGFVDGDKKRLEAIKRGVGSGDGAVDFKFYQSISQIKHDKVDVFVIISNSLLSHIPHPTSPILFLRPKDLVVGIGCDRGVRSKEVKDAYLEVLKRWDISPLSIRNLATIDVKKDEKGLLNFTKAHNLRIEFYSKDELAKIPLPSGFSKFVMEKVGVGGVCEPAALKSSGAKRIWVKKQRVPTTGGRGRVTIAIAKVPFTS